MGVCALRSRETEWCDWAAPEERSAVVSCGARPNSQIQVGVWRRACHSLLGCARCRVRDGCRVAWQPLRCSEGDGGCGHMARGVPARRCRVGIVGVVCGSAAWCAVLYMARQMWAWRPARCHRKSERCAKRGFDVGASDCAAVASAREMACASLARRHIAVCKGAWLVPCLVNWLREHRHLPRCALTTAARRLCCPTCPAASSPLRASRSCRSCSPSCSHAATRYYSRWYMEWKNCCCCCCCWWCAAYAACAAAPGGGDPAGMPCCAAPVIAAAAMAWYMAAGDIAAIG